MHILSKIVHFTPLSEKILFSHRHKLGLKRQMKKKMQKMQDICNKVTKTTAASLILSLSKWITLSDVWLRLLAFLFIFARHTLLSYSNSVDPDQTPRFEGSDLGLLFAYVLYMGRSLYGAIAFNGIFK